MNKKRIINTISIIAIVLLIAFIGFLFYNKFKSNNNNNSNGEIDDFKDIVSNEKKLNNLVSAIPYSNETIGLYNDAFSKDKSIIDDVIDQAIISSFINYSKQYTEKEEYEDLAKLLIKNQGIIVDKIYNANLINELLNKNYNINLKTYNKPYEIEITNFDLGYCTIKYNKNNSLNYSKILLDNQIYELNEEIIMNEKAVFVVLEGDTYYVYPNSNIYNGQEPLKTFSSNNKKIYEINDFIKEEFKDYKTVFKHTFRKNELGYYWYSTEVVYQ